MGHCPHRKDPGVLKQLTKGFIEQGGLFIVHSFTSTVHAGVVWSLVQPYKYSPSYI